MIYADSSFTASLYALDGNTRRAGEVYNSDRRRPLFFTPWQELELVNTLRLGIHRTGRARQPARYQIGNCLKRINEDLREGRLVRSQPDWPACVRRTGQLSQSHTEKLGVVMLDIWQVACAIELGADTFWTFDEDQEQLARATGHFQQVIGLNA